MHYRKKIVFIILAMFSLVNLAFADEVKNPASTDSAPKYIVYWASWVTQDLNAIAGSMEDVTTFNLAFANIDPLSLQMVGSDQMLVPGYWVYDRWAHYKLDHPKSNVLVAIGGASYGAIWSNTLTDANAVTIAQNVAKAINKKTPVCRNVWEDCTVSGKENDIVGYINLDGIDLDVEYEGRITDQQAANVVKFIQALRQAMPDKKISLTGLSVAADPASCQYQASSQCSFVGSQHSGELIPVLQKVGNIIDNVNVMAYDAGKNYPYQIAVQNYVQYVTPNKVILGLDLETQWDPVQRFLESEQELKNRVVWTTHNGKIGGAMVWALGASSGYGLTDQIRLIKEFGGLLK